MPAADAFFDTSVVLYLLSADSAKAERAEELLLHGGDINVQVLNEIAAVAIRKHALSMEEVREFLTHIRGVCRTHAVTPEIHELGLDIAERHRFALYDSMIVAAALESGCRTLYSEDLQNGQVIDRKLKVINPFAR